MADSHGTMDTDFVLPRLVGLFDFFIVHSFKGGQAINKALGIIKSKKPNSLIVVIEQ